MQNVMYFAIKKEPEVNRRMFQIARYIEILFIFRTVVVGYIFSSDFSNSPNIANLVLIVRSLALPLKWDVQTPSSEQIT